MKSERGAGRRVAGCAPPRGRVRQVCAAAALAVGCAAPAPKAADRAAGPQPQPAESAPADASPALAPLSEREQQLARQLASDVEHLASKIGERSSRELWNQASAADFLVRQLEAARYAVTRQGFELAPDAVAQNLEVQVRGGMLGEEIVVVGAHYDSAVGSPGADDNASGVAALLALARALADARPMRTVRLVAFGTQEQPYWKTAQMGSTVYAKAAAARGDRIVAMLSIEGIGCFSDAARSQQWSGTLAQRFPDRGDFIAIVGNERSAELAERVLQVFRKPGGVPAEGGALPDVEAELGGADHWAFWQVGFPAVIITDTGRLRYAHHGQATDTPDRLDYERMARVVVGIERVVLELASPADRKERKQNPASGTKAPSESFSL
jgi:hypothetical protein